MLLVKNYPVLIYSDELNHKLKYITSISIEDNDWSDPIVINHDGSFFEHAVPLVTCCDIGISYYSGSAQNLRYSLIKNNYICYQLNWSAILD